jgi:hypothetical protein
VIVQALGFIAPMLGLLGMWLAGNRKAVGWALNLGVEGVWVAYALLIHQYGLLASCVLWAGVYARNLRKWRRQ